MLTVRSQFYEKPVSERIFPLKVFSQKDDCDKVTKLHDNLSLSCAITLLDLQIYPEMGSNEVAYKYFVTVLKYQFFISILIFLTTFYFHSL